MKRNTIGLAICLIIALIMAVIAVYEVQESQGLAKLVRVEELAAQSVSLRDTNFDLSLLLSVEAFKTTDNPRTRGVLLDNVQANPQLIQYLHSDSRSYVVAFSPDGKILASGGFNGVIVLWDIVTGRPKGQLAAKWEPPKGYPSKPGEPNLGPVSNLIFSPDGKTLIASVHTLYDDVSIIALWDVATGQPIARPLLENESPYDLILSPDGKTLAISEWGRISFWDLDNGEFIGKFPVQPFKGLGGLNAMSIVSSPVFSPDGKTLAAISSVNTITFWDVSSLQPVGQPLVVGDLYSQNGVERIAFSRDGKTLLTGYADGTLSSLDLATGQSVRRWNPLQTRDSYMPFNYGVVFNPSASLVAISDGSVIHVLDTQTGEQISEPLKGNRNDIGDMAFSADGKMLTSATSAGVILWDLAGRQLLGQILADHGGSSIALSPDGKLLAADTYFHDGIWGPGVDLWDVIANKFVGRLGSGAIFAQNPVAFSPDSRKLATGSNDGVILWDVATRQPLGQLHLGTDSYLSSLAFSPDGKMLAIGRDVDVTLWDTTSPGSSGQSLKAEQALTESLAFSPDGKILAVGDAIGSLFILDVKTLHFTKWAGGLDVVDDIAFSPDGRVLASTSRDGKILLWDAKSRQMISPAFILPTRAIPTTLSFSPDGKLLASGNYDNSIDLWDVATRQAIGQGLLGNTAPMGQVAFSPNGYTLATTGNKIILWDMNPHSWVEKICRRVVRNLTRSEWAQYLPGQTYRATCPQWLLEPVATPTPVATP